MFLNLLTQSRSFRRFDEGDPIPREQLEELVQAARLSPSGANVQPLKYMLVSEESRRENVFPCLSWAGYLREWEGPAPGERPTGYVIILGDREVSNSFGCDHGIAAQSMLLLARYRGWGGCMLGAVDRDRLRTELGIDERYRILLVVACGRPAEAVALEDSDATGSIEYWRDEDGVHHVPKRPLSELIVE